jgi:hypothetical protein
MCAKLEVPLGLGQSSVSRIADAMGFIVPAKQYLAAKTEQGKKTYEYIYIGVSW